MSAAPVSIAYFSDLLCVWAYVAQVRLDELRRNFGGDLRIDYRFVPIFGNVAARIRERWQERGGLQGYAEHVRAVVARFSHVELHPGVWRGDVPAGCLASHAFVKAAAAVLERDSTVERGAGERALLGELIWNLRLAFFRDGRNIGRLDVQCDVAGRLGLPVARIRERLDDGRALADLAEDHELALRHQISGSPTLLLNEGRQKLYGNVGYRIIEANIQELLRDGTDQASWC